MPSLSVRCLLAVLALIGVTACEGTARAGIIYLVGAQTFPTNSSGQLPAGRADFQQSTNSSIASNTLLVNGAGKGISFALSPGANVFTFTSGFHDDAGTGFLGLNLFFNDTGVSFNPPQTGVGIAGNLTVFNKDDHSPGFAVTPPGTTIQSYETTGASVDSAIANGLATFLIDGHTIQVTAFTSDTFPSGAFTITEDAPPPAVTVPEPGTITLVLVGLGGLAGTYLARRRRSLPAPAALHPLRSACYSAAPCAPPGSTVAS